MDGTQGADNASDIESFGLRRLTAHIRDRYHDVHRRELADAIAMARRLERDHVGQAYCPEGLADELAELLAEVDAHQRKEELAIFPSMIAGRSHVLSRPLAQMGIEHARIEARAKRIFARVEAIQEPLCGTVHWRLLKTLCRKIEADLREHARLEEEILFPRFAQFASAQRDPSAVDLEEIQKAIQSRVSQG
jgi:regulator of cell morphogenesis and NO signaling